MVKAPCGLHFPDQLSLGKCALGWKGARERKAVKNVGTQSMPRSYSPAPDDSGLHGCGQEVRAFKHLTPVGRLGLVVFVLSPCFFLTLLSTVRPPAGPPAWSTVCIRQLWVDSQPAADCTTSGPGHLTAALPGNS